LRLKALPLAITVALGVGIPFLAGAGAVLTSRVLHLRQPTVPTLRWLYIQHGVQFALALIAIAIVRRFVTADFGLHAPRDKSYFGAAIAWGAIFGIVATLAGHAPQLVACTLPALGYKLTAANVTGWLFFEGIYVGPTEEIPFRALLVTYLAAAMPRRRALGASR
jgi:hypothetical protein